jgi:arginase family enzyme
MVALSSVLGPRKTAAVFFPFDCFGHAGTGRGAELLADAIREMLTDNRHEQAPARGHSYTPFIQVRETAFPTEKKLSKWRACGRKLVRESLANAQRLVWIAGNHLGVLPLYDELAQIGGDTLVLQFDAHLDIFNLTDCEAQPSHGNFLMHVDAALPTIMNIGSRDLMLSPDHVRKYYQKIFPASDLARNPGDVVTAVIKAVKKAKRIVVDLDCDVFDPAFFPAVLHPMPCGLAPSFLLGLFQEIDPRRIDVLAISEFAPSKDREDQGLGTILWLLEWLFLSWYELEPDQSKCDL